MCSVWKKTFLAEYSDSTSLMRFKLDVPASCIYLNQKVFFCECRQTILTALSYHVKFQVRKYAPFVVVETQGDKLSGSAGFNSVAG